MVSPPDKHGAPIEALTREGGLILASGRRQRDHLRRRRRDRRRSRKATAAPNSSRSSRTRDAHGWTTQDIATPNIKAQGISSAPRPSTSSSRPISRRRWWNRWAQLARRTAVGARSDTGDDILARRRDRRLPAARDRSERATGHGIRRADPLRLAQHPISVMWCWPRRVALSAGASRRRGCTSGRRESCST